MKQTSSSSSPSPLAIQTQQALEKAVKNVLERKRKLGHYSVTSDHQRIVIQGDDAPTN